MAFQSIGKRNQERIDELEKNQKKPAAKTVAKPAPVDRNFQTKTATGAKTKKKSLMGSQVSREPDITNSMY